MRGKGRSGTGGGARYRPAAGAVSLLALLALTGPVLGAGAASAEPPPAAAAEEEAAVAGAAAARTVVSWDVDLAGVADDDANVRHTGDALRIRDTGLPAASAGTGRAEGSAVLPVHRLAHGVNRVAAEVVADVPPGTRMHVDVRGRDRDRPWTEWREASPGSPAELPRTVTDVQARLTLQGGPGGDGPVVRRLRLTADDAAVTTPRPAAAEAFTARVFATREGLVGGTTANGHVIRPNDHFVALPSRRGLSPKGSGEYSVRVCGPARCETAPVWDVGPWNTRDDHWNPSSVRETFKDLPQGLPEAQAAYESGYNGGLDGFGRRVLNPAGIDLADGTFYNVGLNDNGWVTVTYLWTGDGSTAKSLRAWDTGVDVRRSAATASDRLASLTGPTAVPARCRVRDRAVQADGSSNDGRSLPPDHGAHVPDIHIGVARSWLPEVPAC
ncbi:hypothetical protein [Streptomyces sp. NPDC003023]|uniref:hypothetical protein n=1 Tax=Streptomyces sp. NPDC003023 TaxID=3364675 RepID=UPI0036A367ED